METVFLLAYLALYRANRNLEVITAEALFPQDARIALLIIMLSFAIPVVIVRAVVGNTKHKNQLPFNIDDFNIKKYLLSDLLYSAFCVLILTMIYNAEKNHFDFGLREFGVSVFIYWFSTIALGFLRWFPAQSKINKITLS